MTALRAKPSAKSLINKQKVIPLLQFSKKVSILFYNRLNNNQLVLE